MKYVLTVLLAGPLAADLTPDYCRQVGVNVTDGAVVSGSVTEHSLDWRAVNIACGKDLSKAGATVNGCARERDDNQWDVYYSNPCVRQHELCHAMYETAEHTAESVELKRWSAACGRVDPFQGKQSVGTK